MARATIAEVVPLEEGMRKLTSDQKDLAKRLEEYVSTIGIIEKLVLDGLNAIR